MILNAPAGRLSFLQPSLSAKAKEKLQTQELFPKDGCLGWRTEDQARKVLPVAIPFRFPRRGGGGGGYFLYHLFRLTSTSTLGPN